MSRDFVELLRRRATEQPAQVAYVFDDGEGGERPVDYAWVDRRARAVAAALAADGVHPGDRVLLMFAPGADYVVGFFACLYSGAIAVPVYPPDGPRGLERVRGVLADCAPSTVLSTSDILALAEAGFGTGGLRWLATDTVDDTAAAGWVPVPAAPDGVAFLQYTSGSTAAPKGVRVTHANLVHNSSVISAALGLGAHSVGASWLPPYHDMGLIGGILQPLYGGFPCVLMPPAAFLYQPRRWLDAISRHRATISAAPDFAYSACVRRIPVAERAGLDLSSWAHALVGAEAVRPATLREFTDAFVPCGLPPTSLYPCYGLAEATLFVTGGRAARSATVLEVDRDRLAGGVAVPGPGLALTNCGRTHGSDEVRVVDPATATACPSDVVGEVWVAGPTVAAGYWHAPADPAFGATLAGDARPWLRTGDLGFQHDGDLYLAGRVKEVLVVRGRNHHPHDLELTAETAHPLLRPHRGAAFGVEVDGAEAAVLVHEVTREFRDDDRAAVEEAIRQAVVAGHGIALYDVLLVRGGAVPRTSSGKIRRAACRDAYLAGTLTAAGPGPTTGGAATAAAGRGRARPGRGSGPGSTPRPDHADLAALVARVLRIEAASLSTEDTLVGLGLDSLTAAELQAALADRAGITIGLDRLLGSLTVGDLLALTPEPAGPAASPPVEPPPAGTGPAPASFGQQRLWVLHRADPGSSAYHIGAGLRLRGRLDADALVGTLRAVVARHAALRTTVVLDDDGVLRQRVRDGAALPLDRHELPDEAALAGFTAAFVRRPFDLAAAPPLRAALVRLADDDHHLLVAAHHAILDAASLRLVLEDLAGARSGTVTQYPDWSRAERAAMTPERLAPHFDYWRSQLRGAGVLRLPPPPGRAAGTEAHRVDIDLPEPLVTQLRAIARAAGGTPFMVLLAGYAAVLSRWSGQDDVVVATPLHGRDRPGASDVVGFLTNTVALRLPVPHRSTVDELLASTRAACLGAYAHGSAPFEKVIEAVQPDRSAGRPPLAQTMLALRRLPDAVTLAGGVIAEPYEVPPAHAQFDVALHLTEYPDGHVGGYALARPDALAADDLRRLVTAYGVLLAGLGDAAPADPVGLLPVQSTVDRTRLVAGYGRGPVVAYEDLCLHQLVERQVDLTPEAVAVVFGDAELTYAELDGWSNRLAHRLAGSGVGIESLVGLGVPRSIELVVAILAVLKAGAAYVPLDPDYPRARLDFMLADAGVTTVLTAADVTADLSGYPAHRPSVGVRPDNLAYVIYTSGSTGTPKGVMNAHRGVANRIRWGQRQDPLGADDAVLQKTSLGFDVSGEELYWPLVAGARLVVARPGGHREADYLADLVTSRRVTTVHFVPSMLSTFLAHGTAAVCAGVLRRVVCSGEALPPAVAARCHEVLPGVRLFNFYGPTEAGIEVVATECRPADARVAIGTPIDNTRAYALDPYGEPTPAGVPGELHVGGVQVARGYWRRPGLTARSFVPDPFGHGARLYRTGDQVRVLPDGNIDYLGRRDQQVKIRGVRIELGEIEASLCAHPAVRAAAVDARPGPGGTPRLVGYLVCAGPAPSAAELRAHLADRLPPAMLPAAYVTLPELPLNPSGKLDRTALPDPETPTADGYAAPRTLMEETLVDIWSDVLGVDRVGIHDDFFALGGHSLLATQVLVRVRAALGVEPPLAELLSGHPTVARLAEVIAVRQLADTDPDELLALIAELDDAT